MDIPVPLAHLLQALEAGDLPAAKAAAAELQRTSAGSTQLAAEVLHELRQPLLGVKAYTQMLSEEIGARGPLRQMLAQVERMEQIISDFTRLASERPAPQQAVSLVTHVQAAARSFALNPDSARVTLQVEAPEDLHRPGQWPAAGAAHPQPPQQRARRGVGARAREGGGGARGDVAGDVRGGLGPGRPRGRAPPPLRALRDGQQARHRAGARGVPAHRAGAPRAAGARPVLGAGGSARARHRLPRPLPCPGHPAGDGRGPCPGHRRPRASPLAPPPAGGG